MASTAPACSPVVELFRDPRVETDTGNVEERPTRHHAGVDRSRLAVESDCQSGAWRARHTERAREAVARTGTHESDRRVGVQHTGTGFVHRAVAAPHDDQLRTGGGARGREIVRVAGALGHVNLRARPSPLDLAPHERDATRTGRAGPRQRRRSD